MEECRKVLDEVFGVSSSDSNDTVETSSTSSVSPQTVGCRPHLLSFIYVID